MEREASVRMKGGLRHVDDPISPRQPGTLGSIFLLYVTCTCMYIIRDSNSN